MYNKIIYIYRIEYTLGCWLLCLSFLHYCSSEHAGTPDSLLSPSELSSYLTCCCWTVDRPHERNVGVDSERFRLKETWLISNFWQEFGSFLWGCNHTAWNWCQAGLFNFSRPSLPVLSLISDSRVFSKFLWPGLNQLSPEKSTNSFNRIASKL